MFESDPVLTYAFSIVTVVFGGRGGNIIPTVYFSKE